MISKCWLRDGCPSRTGSCSSCQPTDDGCPVYRWFRDRFITRCRDCKYWQDNNDGYPHPGCRWGHDETPDENDYCSYAERIDE